LPNAWAAPSSSTGSSDHKHTRLTYKTGLRTNEIHQVSIDVGVDRPQRLRVMVHADITRPLVLLADVFCEGKKALKPWSGLRAAQRPDSRSSWNRSRLCTTVPSAKLSLDASVPPTWAEVRSRNNKCLLACKRRCAHCTGHLAIMQASEPSPRCELHLRLTRIMIRACGCKRQLLNAYMIDLSAPPISSGAFKVNRCGGQAKPAKQCHGRSLKTCFEHTGLCHRQSATSMTPSGFVST